MTGLSIIKLIKYNAQRKLYTYRFHALHILAAITMLRGIGSATLALLPIGASVMVKLLSPEELKTKKGIAYSRSQLHRKIADGTFPMPVKLGGNKNGWIEGEIDEWIDARIKERDKARPVQTTAEANNKPEATVV